MGRSSTSRLGLPSAAGTVTRLAYANAKASGVDMQALLTKAGLTLQQINNANLRLRVRYLIKFCKILSPLHLTMTGSDFIVPNRTIFASSALSSGHSSCPLPCPFSGAKGTLNTMPRRGS